MVGKVDSKICPYCKKVEIPRFVPRCVVCAKDRRSKLREELREMLSEEQLKLFEKYNDASDAVELLLFLD